MAFAKAQLALKMSEMDMSENSITSLSRWVSSFPSNVADSVYIWEVEFKRSPSRRLLYLYLANDVLQSTKRTVGTYFIDQFLPAIQRSIGLAIREGDDTTFQKIKKMVKVWKDRKILSSEQQLEIDQIIQNKGKEPKPQGTEFQPPTITTSLDDLAPKDVLDESEDPELLSTDGEEEYDPLREPVTPRVESTSDVVLTPAQKSFFEMSEAWELAEVEIDLAREKVERLESIITRFEHPDSANTPALEPKPGYEVVMTQETIRLAFTDAETVLKENEERFSNANSKDDEIIEVVTQAMDESNGEMEIQSEGMKSVKESRSRLRVLARTVFKESLKRKRERMERDAKEREEAKRIAREQQEALEKKMAEQKRIDEERKKTGELATAFLASLGSSQPPSPPIQPPAPGGAPVLNTASTLSLMQSLSKLPMRRPSSAADDRYHSSQQSPTSRGSEPYPPSRPPPSNAIEYRGEVYNPHGAIPPRDPPPPNARRFRN